MAGRDWQKLAPKELEALLDRVRYEYEYPIYNPSSFGTVYRDFMRLMATVLTEPDTLVRLKQFLKDNPPGIKD